MVKWCRWQKKATSEEKKSGSKQVILLCLNEVQNWSSVFVSTTYPYSFLVAVNNLLNKQHSLKTVAVKSEFFFLTAVTAQKYWELNHNSSVLPISLRVVVIGGCPIAQLFENDKKKKKKKKENRTTKITGLRSYPQKLFKPLKLKNLFFSANCY